MLRLCKSPGCRRVAVCAEGHCEEHHRDTCGGEHQMRRNPVPDCASPHGAVGVELEVIGNQNAIYRTHTDVVEDGSLPGGESGEIRLCAPCCRIGPTIESVCDRLVYQNCRTDSRCGLHIHLDARSMDLDGKVMQEFKRWLCRTERQWFDLIPPGRRECDYLNGLVDQGFEDSHEWPREHYDWAHYTQHGTVEIRIHPGTIKAAKVNAWVSVWSNIFHVLRAHEHQTRGKYLLMPHPSKWGDIETLEWLPKRAMAYLAARKAAGGVLKRWGGEDENNDEPTRRRRSVPSFAMSPVTQLTPPPYPLFGSGVVGSRNRELAWLRLTPEERNRCRAEIAARSPCPWTAVRVLVPEHEGLPPEEWRPVGEYYAHEYERRNAWSTLNDAQRQRQIAQIPPPHALIPPPTEAWASTETQYTRRLRVWVELSPAERNSIRASIAEAGTWPAGRRIQPEHTASSPPDGWRMIGSYYSFEWQRVNEWANLTDGGRAQEIREMEQGQGRRIREFMSGLRTRSRSGARHVGCMDDGCEVCADTPGTRQHAAIVAREALEATLITTTSTTTTDPGLRYAVPTTVSGSCQVVEVDPNVLMDTSEDHPTQVE